MLLSWRGDIVPCDSALSACRFSLCSSLLDQLMFPIIFLISRDAHGKLKKFVQSHEVSFITACLYRFISPSSQKLDNILTVHKIWFCSLSIPLLISCYVKVFQSLNVLQWHFCNNFCSVLFNGYSKTMVQVAKYDFLNKGTVARWSALSPNLTWVVCPCPCMLPCNKPATFPGCIG